MQIYIAIISTVMFLLSLASAIILYSNPETFRVKWWVKLSGYIAFITDVAGGLVAFMWATLNLPDAFAEAALAMVLTSASWMLGVFIFVHAYVIPQHRKGRE